MTIQKSSQRKPKNGRLKHLRSKHIDNIQLLILALPAIVLLFVFCYIPMGGIILAFKKFRVDLGIFDSPWVGFENFEFFFTSSDAWRVVRNTLGMNFLFIYFVHHGLQRAVCSNDVPVKRPAFGENIPDNYADAQLSVLGCGGLHGIRAADAGTFRAYQPNHHAVWRRTD